MYQSHVSLQARKPFPRSPRKSRRVYLKSDIKAHACDATAEDEVKKTWNKIVEDFDKVDVLVTAAGIVDNVEAEN